MERRRVTQREELQRERRWRGRQRGRGPSTRRRMPESRLAWASSAKGHGRAGRRGGLDGAPACGVGEDEETVGLERLLYREGQG